MFPISKTQNGNAVLNAGAVCLVHLYCLIFSFILYEIKRKKRAKSDGRTDRPKEEQVKCMIKMSPTWHNNNTTKNILN